jgi:hypothetical protein
MRMQSKSIQVRRWWSEPLANRYNGVKFFFTNLLQRLLATGKRNGIGMNTRRRKISRGKSGSMCDGSMITATGGMGGQEEHLQ